MTKRPKGLKYNKPPKPETIHVGFDIPVYTDFLLDSVSKKEGTFRNRIVNIALLEYAQKILFDKKG